MTAPVVARVRRGGATATAAFAVVVVLGLVATTVAALAVAALQRRETEQVVDRRADIAGWAVSGEAARYLAATEQMAAAVGTHPSLTAAEFTALAAPLHTEDLAGAAGIGLILPVADDGVAALQARQRRLGEPGLTLQPAPGVAEHRFIVLNQTLDGRPSPVGPDTVVSGPFTAALEAATLTSGPVISSPYVLLKDLSLPKAQQQLSFIVAAAVPPPATSTGRPSGSAPAGWVVLGLHGQDFADHVLRATSQGLVNLSLTDGTAGTARPIAQVTTGKPWTDGRVRTLTLPVAQATWRLRVQGTALAAAQAGPHALVFLAAAVGVLATVLLAALTWMLVAGRSRALRSARTARADSLRQSALLQAVIDSIGEGVSVIDPEGRFLLQNAAAIEILGVTEDVDGPEPWQEHYGVYRSDGETPFPGEEMPLIRALGGSSSNQVDMVIRNAARPRGRTISVSARPLEPGTPGIETGGAVAVFRDVTDRRQLEVMLRGQHDRYERLLAILSDLGEGVVVTDAGRITYGNEAYARITGYTLPELLALPSLSVLTPDREAAAEYAGMSAELAKAGISSHALVTRVRRKDGSILPVEVVGVRTLARADGPDEADEADGDGGQQRVFVIRDLSERRRWELDLADRAAALEAANAELSVARAEAEATSAAKTRFLAMMSHEIRTPLNGILGFTALLAADPDAPDRAAWSAAADHSGRALLDIVNNSLDLAKIEAGGLELETIELDLIDLARQAVLPSQMTAEAAGVQLHLRIAGTLGRRRLGDPTRLRQVMTNLVANAVKFTPSGSVTLALDGHGEHVRIQVRDTGIGMTEQQCEKLFQPFQQADRETTRRYGGTGLGLSITHGIVQAMHGSIAVTSTPGEGSTFTVEVELPRASRPAHAEPGETAETAQTAETGAARPVPGETGGPSLRGRRVLLAEDNKVNQLVAKAMFEARGLRVDVVENGEEAVARATAEPYDAIFMDCEMPVLGGLDATRAIRAHEQANRGPHVHIVALTANAFDDNRQQCLDAGMDDFLPKPWTADQLSATLTRLARLAPVTAG